MIKRWHAFRYAVRYAWKTGRAVYRSVLRHEQRGREYDIT